MAVADPLPRVVSMNLCTDQLTLLLAEPKQILSLTELASDPRSSPMVAEAAPYPKNTGGAEEILALAPDVVLAGSYSDGATLSMLRRLGMRVEQLPIPTRLEEIPGQIRTIGAILQQEARAEALASSIEDRLAALGTPAQDSPVAAFFYPNGYSLGEGTLSHDIVTAAGFRNLGETLGMGGGGRLSLEQLVIHAPDVLIASPRYPGHSRSEDLSFHPVLAEYAAQDRLIFSTSEWTCGTPHTLHAIEAVAAARAALTPSAPRP
jgi:iron complex transport system substrate-binding protein